MFFVDTWPLRFPNNIYIRHVLNLKNDNVLVYDNYMMEMMMSCNPYTTAA